MKCHVGMFLIGFLSCFSLSSYAQQTTFVSGTLNLAEQKINVKFGDKTRAPFDLEAVKVSDTSYDIRLVITEWDLSLFKVSTILKGSLKILVTDEGKSYALGQFSSDHILLNSHSFGSLTAEVLINNKEVVVRSFTFGPFSSSGKVSFLPRTEIDLVLKFSQASMVDIFSIFKEPGKVNLEGIVDADLRLSGSPEQLQIRGILNSFDGLVQGYRYNTARLNILGVYPLINVTDSYVAQNDGFSFEINGVLDLSDMKNFETQIKNFTGKPLVSDEGQGREWTLKRTQSQGEGVTTEFKYMLRKDDDREDAIIGIERKIEF